MIINNFPTLLFTRALLTTIILLLLLCVFSCSPEKRLHKLVSKNPELLKKDTVLKEVIVFRVDTIKVDSSTNIAGLELQEVINNLILDLDSCSNSDKAKIESLTPAAKIIFKKRLINDCPEIIAKELLKFTTDEGHTVILTPNSVGGYDLNLVVNCPIPILKDKSFKWYNWLLIGFAIGILVSVLLKN